MIEPPFRLKEGLFLETRQVLLPWNQKIETLALIGQPDRHKDRKTIFLSWKEDTIFGGVTADIYLRSDEDRFSIRAASDCKSTSPTTSYTTILAELSARLGSPSAMPDNEDIFGNVFPRSLWQFGQVEVSLAIGEHFMEYVALTISRSSQSR